MRSQVKDQRIGKTIWGFWCRNPSIIKHRDKGSWNSHYNIIIIVNTRKQYIIIPLKEKMRKEDR